MAIQKFALILCNFTDVAISPNTPPSYFQNYLTPGSGGLLDYWHDISYGQVSLSGSTVYGWWPSQYSLIQDGARGRGDFIAEARRLAMANNVDLSPYYGLMVFFNANTDGGNLGRDMNGCLGGRWGQADWKWCSKCDALNYAGFSAGPCPAGGLHLTLDPNYSLALNIPVGNPSQDKWCWCKKCQALNYGGGSSVGACSGGAMHDNSQSGNYALRTGSFGGWDPQWRWCRKCQVLVSDATTRPCAGGGNHDTSQSEVYCLLQTTGDTINVTGVAHELGHCLGLQHSWSASPEREYGDPWDIMSAMNVKSISGARRPGREWRPRISNILGSSSTLWSGRDQAPGFQASNSSCCRSTVTPAANLALWRQNCPRVIACIMSNSDKLPGGMPRLRVRLSSSMRRGLAVLPKMSATDIDSVRITRPCAAGGQHDHTGSWYYTLFRDAPTVNPPAKTPNTQGDWQCCAKCQSLTYSGSASSGPCPGGGQHDHTGSGSYALLFNNTFGSTQTGWLWCQKCQSLNYGANASLGACQAGGTHDNSQSGKYALFGNTRNSFLLGDASGTCDWQLGKVFVAKDTGMCVVVHSFGSINSIPTVSLTIGDAQSNWKLCSKCQGLFYSGISSGVCPAGGSHQAAGSANYSLLHDVRGSSGQDNWHWCSKCQGLAYAGVSSGVCPAGANHDSSSYDYVLLHDVAMTDAQANWRWCNKCQGLLCAGTYDGVCPAGGTHNVQSDDYNMINV
jgi:hypothetical protein